MAMIAYALGEGILCGYKTDLPVALYRPHAHMLSDSAFLKTFHKNVPS